MNKQDYNEYMREYLLRRYKKVMQEAKEQLGNKCSICGSESNLDFDHIDPSIKSFTIGSNWGTTKERLQKELAKCQLLCRSCHIEKHSSKEVCGTVNMYSYGCRCDKCKFAHKEYMRDYMREYRKTHIREGDTYLRKR